MSKSKKVLPTSTRFRVNLFKNHIRMFVSFFWILFFIFWKIVNFQYRNIGIFRFLDNNSKPIWPISKKKIDHRQWVKIKGCEFHQNWQEKSKNRKKNRRSPLASANKYIYFISQVYFLSRVFSSSCYELCISLLFCCISYHYSTKIC